LSAALHVGSPIGLHACAPCLLNRNPCRRSRLRRCLEFIGVGCGSPRWIRVDPSASAAQNDRMSQQEIDEYLANLDEPKRTTLQQPRQTSRTLLPRPDETDPEPRPSGRVR